MKKIAIIFFILSPFYNLAQERNWQNKLALGFSLGANYSRFDFSNLPDLKPAARPYFGISGIKPISTRWSLNLDFQYASKSSNLNLNQSYEQNGIDLNLHSQYKIDDFYFGFGLANQVVVVQRINNKGSSFTEESRAELSELKQAAVSFNPMLSMEFKLIDNWRMTTSYQFPLINTNLRNFQIGISYRISEKKQREETQRARRKRVAERQINELRNGSLFIRLKTNQPKIDALNKLDRTYTANEVKKQQEIENRSLIKAFEAKYDYSPFYFFSSEDSKAIMRGDYEGKLLNSDLEKDSTIQVRNEDHIFFLDLGLIEEDTTRIFSHYEWESTGNFAEKRVERFYSPHRNTFYALVLKDNKFNQLSRPFPYYARALFKAMSENPGHGLFFFPLKLLFPSTPMQSVENLNFKLYQYLYKVKRKENRKAVELDSEF